ncbi:MAG: class I lanthipeptide [Acidobacteria bacterium]|jgi:hypothetical protein|nr:class I lanthipeptide [Acidobacteriota bacterium]
MKKNLPRKLNLNRETLRQLEESALQVRAGAELTGTGPYTLQLACHSAQIPSCRCTVAV